MLVEETADLFDLIDVVPAFAHGVNNLGRMHAGIAIEFRNRYPEMYREYRKQCYKGELKGGSFFFWPTQNDMPAVFNLVTQETLEHANKDFLMESMERMMHMAVRMEIQAIAVPLIGCGYGKLSRDDFIEASLPFIRDCRHHLILVEKEPVDGVESHGCAWIFE